MFDKKELVNDKTGEHYTKYFYTYNESDQIVGILFGHFAPFTGPNGHGRMVTALKNIGAESFLIVTPENNKHFDDEREMFNATQRAEIIQSYLDSEGLNGVALPYKMKRGGAKSQMGPLVALAAEKFGLNIRPVFCFGPDREDLAAEVCNKFGEIKDPTHCEYIVDYERGTSGTKVRQLIKANDIEGICKETGYKTEVAEKLIKLRTENMKMNESKLDESLGPSGEVIKAIKGDYKIKDLTYHNKRNFGESFESIYNESAEFEEAYKMKEWIGKNSVTLNFSDREDATEFKDEMKKKFHYPKTRSQYEVVHGTTPSGHAVFVESFKQIYNESCYTPFGSTRMNNMYFCLMTEIEKLRQKDEWPEEVESPLALENKVKELMNDGYSEWEVESYGNELAEYIANELIEDGKCYYN